MPRRTSGTRCCIRCGYIFKSSVGETRGSAGALRQAQDTASPSRSSPMGGGLFRTLAPPAQPSPAAQPSNRRSQKSKWTSWTRSGWRRTAESSAGIWRRLPRWTVDVRGKFARGSLTGTEIPLSHWERARVRDFLRGTGFWCVARDDSVLGRCPRSEEPIDVCSPVGR